MNKVTILLNVCAVLVLTSNMSMASTESSNIHPDLKGSWANKDEDGDGVLDAEDDFPFLPQYTKYPHTVEKEFNNNVAQANTVGKLPFSVEGVLSLSADIDDFKFIITDADVEAGKSVSFVVIEQSPRFHPQLGIFKNNGRVVQHIDIAIDKVTPIGTAIAFTPKQSGEYNLSVLDYHANHADDFKYQAYGFVDTDKDGVPDNKEQALGLNYKIQDSDGDGIADGNEYWILSENGEFVHDVDADSKPNWSDDDSDGDGILDTLEGTVDDDRDQLPAFADLDSDNNDISDSEEQRNNAGILIDTDNDALPDYIDIDDDGDAVLDINDSRPKETLFYNRLTSEPKIKLGVTIYELTKKIKFINKARVSKHLKLKGENIPQQGGLAVITKGDERLPVVNIPLEPQSQQQASIILPHYDDVSLGGEELTLFIVNDNIRSNDITIKLLHPKTPLIKSISTHRAEPSEQVQVRGENIDDFAELVMGENHYEVDWISSKLATFDVPKEAISGRFYLQNVYGKSNSLHINIVNNRDVKIEIAAPSAYESLHGEVKVLPHEKSMQN
ncbi:hypothetical protein EXT46_13055 [Pseudoalteromonas sp. CO325X]|uniref:hypothetical protein n=1 Tax=Pseudoalteromonas sp. CO325X TaxID=1777262 RepID=UPI001023A049|nr:hypothetical protein [Pseudoalteromonas sp. CO325X]RZF80222.1 hypothetical protein EXT46_13055 [Pseudoalteromonas sp. CO325X]